MRWKRSPHDRFDVRGSDSVRFGWNTLFIGALVGLKTTGLTRPILATGFDPTTGPLGKLFPSEAGAIQLTERDESAETPGLFLAGPSVAHGGQDFCFIYEFRSRFPVVAETIGDRLGVNTDPLDAYRESSMFLEDLSCCEPIDCDY